MQNHPLQQIDFNTSNNAYVIEASAGTGKTWTIERLFIKALLEQTSDNNTAIGVENILVVTFTNDATNELKERIASQIKTTIDDIIIIQNSIVEDPDFFAAYLKTRKQLFKRDLTILSRALQNFDWASIYTIHGFCNKILHDYPFECLVNPEFDLVSDKSDIIKSLVLNFMRTEVINKSSTNLEIILANLEKMFDSRDYTQTLVDKIAAKIPKDILTIKNSEYLAKYSFDVDPTLDKLSNSEFDTEELRVAKAEFLASVINYININYIENNMLSFDELIERIADRLANSNTLSDKIFNLFPVAFIDEFQDTDKLQWEIFSSIYHLGDKKRGNVVVVGDPKQAIYSFRGADIDTYIEARQQINNNLRLDSNFRSHKNILNFVNILFLGDGLLGDGISYSPSNANYKEQYSLPAAHDISVNVHGRGVNKEFYDENVQLVVINGATKALRTEALLRSITFEILSLLNTDQRLGGKIAILVSKNSECTQIVEYLRSYGLTATELKLGNIFATNTANDLYLLLNSLFDLGDKRNFIKAITTRLFNLDLGTLAGVELNENKGLQALSQVFYDFAQIWKSKGVISLVYALVNHLFQNDTYSLNNRELANIWQLAELLNACSASNQTELLFWFRQKITTANNNLEASIDGANEELVRLDNDDEQILVTTVHKSKGLEFDIVFCPFFKSNVTLDGANDYNYKRPFFGSYRDNGVYKSSMIMDKELGNQIVQKTNKESQRLNYVALTRAKMRLYIYLKQPTILKSGNYSAAEKPDKITELFGYVKNNPNDLSHHLFNYPNFFSKNPNDGFKNSIEGVVAYNRNDISDNELMLMRFVNTETLDKKTKLIDVSIHPKPVFYRQSYTMLTKTNSEIKYSDNDDTENPIADISYRYSILSDKDCSGATFGVLFHHLCENYPFSQEKLSRILNEYNIYNEVYQKELTEMIGIAFNYPIIDGACINDFSNSMHELEFNLSIKNRANIGKDISSLMSEYFGHSHPFTLASQSLEIIEEGFLVGFIDLIFEHSGKYFVLDYKTNTLLDYKSTSDINDFDNPLVISMTEHHYYLQYLLYLVALKRYLEQRLKIEDAGYLLGGAVYYYVRGIYTTDKPQGICIDKNCQKLVGEIDKLFKRYD